jgi:hypothetical protein
VEAAAASEEVREECSKIAAAMPLWTGALPVSLEKLNVLLRAHPGRVVSDRAYSIPFIQSKQASPFPAYTTVIQTPGAEGVIQWGVKPVDVPLSKLFYCQLLDGAAVRKSGNLDFRSFTDNLLKIAGDHPYVAFTAGREHVEAIGLFEQMTRAHPWIENPLEQGKIMIILRRPQ